MVYSYVQNECVLEMAGMQYFSFCYRKLAEVTQYTAVCLLAKAIPQTWGTAICKTLDDKHIGLARRYCFNIFQSTNTLNIPHKRVLHQ